MVKEKKLKFSKENRFLFWYGILFGLLGGIIGNSLVTSCFTLITQSYKDDLGLYSTLFVMIFSVIFYIILINKLTKKLYEIR